MVGSEGAIMVDDSHRDVSINTMKRGIEFPLSTMPGEKVEHVYADAHGGRGDSFSGLRGARYKQPLVTPEHAQDRSSRSLSGRGSIR